MKKLFFLLFISVFFYNTTEAQKAVNFSETELIIKFKADTDIDYKNCLFTQKFKNSTIDALNKKAEVKSIKATGNKKEGRTYVLKFKNKSDIDLLVKDYLNTGLFEYVEPNYIGKGHGVQFTPNDPLYYNRQWSHYNDGTFPLSNATTDADIDSELAWDITQGSSSIMVAVIDSGLKLDHPEFSGRIWQNNGETSDGTDTDGNGYIDDLYGGWDFANNDNNPSDDHGHGTNVAGIAVATGNNNMGYAGVNWSSGILICKALDSNNSGYYTWMTDAIYYAVDNGAHVINMSIGGNSASGLLEDAVNYAYNNNVYLVVSAGNQNSSIQYPARYANALAIGSTNSDDTRSNPFFWDPNSGSNYGPELDFSAPGNYIYGPNHLSNSDYGWYWGGTSQAAPHVAGVISLLLSIKPDLTVTQIRTILEDSSEDQVGDSEDTAGWDQYFGHGRLNAYNAVTHQLLGNEQFTSINTNLIVYPNPIINDITIDNIEQGNYTIVLYDILGKQQFNYSTSSIDNQITMKIPKLAEGTYLMKITEVSLKSTITKKIIVQ